MKTNKATSRLKITVPTLPLIFCLLAVFLPGLQFYAHATPGSLTVTPGQSIQAAINSSSPGGTIFVQDGVYNESLQINKNIFLIGTDRNQTIINGQNNQATISITADNVIIENFTIESNLTSSIGIDISFSAGDTITQNLITNSSTGISLTSSNNNTISDNTITANGTVNQNSGVSISFSTGDTITRNIIQNSLTGLNVTSSDNNAISDNTITANSLNGITLESSTYNTFEDNNVISNFQTGISLYLSDSNVFLGNLISSNGGSGFNIQSSGGNTFVANNVTDNYPEGGIISYSNFNSFYFNNFFDPISSSPGLNNTWDDGYQGNYWNGFVGVDNGNGTSSTPYINQPIIDNHPLMGKVISLPIDFGEQTFHVYIVSNSSIVDTGFQVGTETGDKIVSYNIQEEAGSTGFSRIAVPTGLMDPSSLLISGQENIAWKFVNGSDPSYSYLYFTYPQDSQTILVVSSKIVQLYNQLNATYYELLGNYSIEQPIISSLYALNATYTQFASNYTSLLANYTILQKNFNALNASYQQHLTDSNQSQQNVRSLMYIFAATTAVLIVATVYFSKRAFAPQTKDREEKPILS